MAKLSEDFSNIQFLWLMMASFTIRYSLFIEAYTFLLRNFNTIIFFLLLDIVILLLGLFAVRYD